jgi:inorganic triphosphatase YgiF
MNAEPGTDSEIEWQFEAPDPHLVLRWLQRARDESTDQVRIAKARTIDHVDSYLDTKDRELDRAGYSVRLRRSEHPPYEATLKTLDAPGPDALRIRRELSEPVELDEPGAVRDAPGPVGEQVRAVAGSRELERLFDLETRRRVFPLATAEAPSGELLLDETTIREADGRIIGRLSRVEVEVPETAIPVVRPFVESLQRDCDLQPAELSKYEAALKASGRRRSSASDDVAPHAGSGS